MRYSRYEGGGNGDDEKQQKFNGWNVNYVCIADFMRIINMTISKVEWIDAIQVKEVSLIKH